MAHTFEYRMLIVDDDAVRSQGDRGIVEHGAQCRESPGSRPRMQRFQDPANIVRRDRADVELVQRGEDDIEAMRPD